MDLVVVRLVVFRENHFGADFPAENHFEMDFPAEKLVQVQMVADLRLMAVVQKLH